MRSRVCMILIVKRPKKNMVFGKNYLIYGNIMLFLVTTDKLILSPAPIRKRLPDFFHSPSDASEGS